MLKMDDERWKPFFGVIDTNEIPKDLLLPVSVSCIKYAIDFIPVLIHGFIR